MSLERSSSIDSLFKDDEALASQKRVFSDLFSDANIWEHRETPRVGYFRYEIKVLYDEPVEPLVNHLKDLFKSAAYDFHCSLTVRKSRKSVLLTIQSSKSLKRQFNRTNMKLRFGRRVFKVEPQKKWQICGRCRYPAIDKHWCIDRRNLKD